MLPAGVSDLLPCSAEAVESLRRRLLDLYRAAGYRLVQPPLVEYVDSLLIGSGRDLGLSTFKLIDQMSGRTLGVRPDITPQVARIDAHLLQESGPSRLCYCASALHAVPAVPGASRELLQIGAELYGHAGPHADVELIDLMLRSLQLAGVGRVRLDLSDHGLVRLLLARLPPAEENELFELLESRNLPGLRDWLDQVLASNENVCTGAQDAARALLELPRCAGLAPQVLERAERVFAGDAQAQQVLQRLRAIISSSRLLAHGDRVEIGLDLSDTRGFRYHTGLAFAAFVDDSPQAIGRGGRYDGIGRAFGRARPATGFSLDLRELVELRDHSDEQRCIRAPWSDDPDLLSLVQSLREQGEIVVQDLPLQATTAQAAELADRRIDRYIEQRDGAWRIAHGTS